MTDQLVVWGAGSTRALRVLWALHEFGLAYESRPVGSRTGETQTPDYLAMNPKGKIPTLQHGDLTLSESGAILDYITHRFPAPDGFFVPRSAGERGRLAEWCYFIAMELDAHTLYVIRRHDGLAHLYGAAPKAVESAREYFLKQVNAVLDRMFTDGPYLMGEKLSTADIWLKSCVGWAIDYGIALPAPLLDFQTRVEQRPAYRAAHAVNYPDRELAPLVAPTP